MLASWNPARREWHINEIELGRRMPKNAQWILLEDWELRRPPNLADVLGAYFEGRSFPRTSFNILKSALSETWYHPAKGLRVPLSVKTLIYRDVARASQVKVTMHDVYLGDLTLEEIETELHLLADFFACAVFNFIHPGAARQALWMQQQLRYLRHQRQRPVFPRNGTGAGVQKKVPPGSLQEPAGDAALRKVLVNQAKPVILQGLMGAYQVKRWSLSKSMPISLGTVGIERAWRTYKDTTGTVRGPEQMPLLVLCYPRADGCVKLTVGSPVDWRRPKT